MSWFNEQIRQREESDQNILEESFFRMASVVMDKWDAERLEDERLISKAAIDDVLKYFHEKPVDIPEDIKGVSEQLEYALRPSGLMVRDVELEEGWQKDAYGPMLGRMTETGATVALLPGQIYGYYYKDPATGRKTRINKKNAKLFDREALCFYQPLPMKKLGIPNLLIYMKNSITKGDIALVVLATLAVTLVGMVEPRVYNRVTGPVLQNRNTNLMTGMVIFLLCSAFSSFFRRAGQPGRQCPVPVRNDPELVYSKNGTTVSNKTFTNLKDLHKWVNPRLWIFQRGKQKYPKATKGIVLAKCCFTIQEKYGCEFIFCSSKDAGKKIVELLIGK